MFKNNELTNKVVESDGLTPRVKAQFEDLYAMLETRYGEGFAESIMRPYLRVVGA